MAEYIEREAAIAWFMPYAHTEESIEADVVISDIKGMKAADVAPVVHGLWDRTNRLGEFDYYNAHCTNCGYEIGASGWSCEWKLPYCPNCGARMDGE